MSAKLGEDKFENSLGWNFGTQYRVLMALLITGLIFKVLASLSLGISDMLILIAGIFVLLTRSKLEIDFKNRTTREARYLLGINVYGSWTPFPDFEYVSIFNAQISNTYASRGNQSTIVTTELQVNLVYNGNRRLTTCEAIDNDTALLTAEYFSKKLGDLRILDATKRPFEWLDEK